MAQVYLPNNNFLNQWRALSLAEMKAQPAFQAVLDYYKTKGQIVPTFGQYLEPNGRVVVTMVFTDASDPSTSQWIEAADAICDPYPTLSRLRQIGVSKTSPNSYDPFDWAPPADPVVPVGPAKLQNTVYVVGNTFDGMHYQNMGPIPFPGAETTDARGTFVAVSHTYPFGTTYDWSLKGAPVASGSSRSRAADSTRQSVRRIHARSTHGVFDAGFGRSQVEDF
jgi:hypothetical protein